MLVLKWKERAFIEKVNSRCFCWFPAAILVHQNGAPIWRLHTKLYKGAWNVSANNSETVGHKDLRLGQIVYILVFYNISFSWFLPLHGFQFIFFAAWQWKRSITLFRLCDNQQLLFGTHDTIVKKSTKSVVLGEYVLKQDGVYSSFLKQNPGMELECYEVSVLSLNHIQKTSLKSGSTPR